MLYNAFISYSHAADGKLGAGFPIGIRKICQALVQNPKPEYFSG